MRPLRRHWQRAFTLLEVMIALAVLAVSAAGLITSVSQNVRQGGALEERTIALWVAQNRLTELQVLGEFPPLGRNEEQVRMSGREWEVIVETKSTAYPDLRLVEVGVALPRSDFRDREGTLATLSAFLGAPQPEAAQ